MPHMLVELDQKSPGIVSVKHQKRKIEDHHLAEGMLRVYDVPFI